VDTVKSFIEYIRPIQCPFDSATRGACTTLPSPTPSTPLHTGNLSL